MLQLYTRYATVIYKICNGYIQGMQRLYTGLMEEEVKQRSHQPVVEKAGDTWREKDIKLQAKRGTDFSSCANKRCGNESYTSVRANQTRLMTS